MIKNENTEREFQSSQIRIQWRRPVTPLRRSGFLLGILVPIGICTQFVDLEIIGFSRDLGLKQSIVFAFGFGFDGGLSFFGQGLQLLGDRAGCGRRLSCRLNRWCVELRLVAIEPTLVFVFNRIAENQALANVLCALAIFALAFTHLLLLEEFRRRVDGFEFFSDLIELFFTL